MEFLEPYHDDDSFTSNKPSIWETEPKEDVVLDISYEIRKDIPIAQQRNNKNMDWCNCHLFVTGLEAKSMNNTLT